MSHRRHSSSAASVSSSSNGAGAGSSSGQHDAGASSTEGNVQVVLRIRPINPHDLVSIPPRFQRISLTPASSTTVSVDAGSSAGSISSKRIQTLNFHYDRVLGPDEGQRDLYEAAASKLVDKFIQGFNVTILAYGQTSSGKSYSMGTALDAGSNDEREILPSTGLVPRAVHDIFAKCAEMERQAGGRANVRFEMTNSFVELYNEDLLDLLSNPDPSTPVSERPTVSIREDKDGHIIWSGLKEVKVGSREDVMRNLQQGSTLRRTNETDMNAQSSRSHAIFSITLTQRKRVGGSSGASSSNGSTTASSVPPSAFANPSAPSTPSRGIPRPASAALANAAASSRTMSPTPGSRPTTPSGLPMLHQRAPSGLRPTNTSGTPRATSPLPPTADNRRLSGILDEDDVAASPARGSQTGSGEWVTVTSKFHFVDLAGSERLKRTSAAGERMKEGISINSGLLALGNVISALGDPAKARTMTHIPYRDSKLTRLLQDSLGGNAHTLMIACVSPAEFNLTETLSTIKYANRARNIKNRAEVNQMEVGWDDIEHLQTTLVKLRKEHAALKAAASQAGISASAAAGAGSDLSSISEEKPSSVAMTRLNSQFSELQEEHANLSDRYRETMVEVARLTRQVEEAKSHGREGGSTNFALMVQPVIEEYEKAIAQMEEELKLSRAALAHTNDLYNEQEIQLAEVTSRNTKTETYNAELRARISKLAERETSNETYIRDLETKLSSFNERDETRGGQVSDLKKEIAQLKQSESTSAKYLAELEAQLATSESSTASLAVKVDRLEKEAARREEMYKDLEARLALVDTTEENKHLLQELDAKDNKVADLERKLEDAFRAMETAGKERATLQEQAARDETERTSLKALLQRSKDGLANGHANGLAPPSTRANPMDDSTFHTPAAELSEEAANQSFDRPTPTPRSPAFEAPNERLEEQLRDLQVSHTRTLAELDEVSAKYRDALKELADLSAQAQEAELRPSTPSRDRSVSPADSQRSDLVPRSGSRGSLASLAGSPGASRHRAGQNRSSIPGATTAVTKDPASPNGQGFGGRGGGHHKQMPSLSQEFSSLPSSRSSWGGPGATLLATSPVRSLSLSPHPERSVQSLEDEIMSLQKVLKQREDEIDHLENTIKVALPHKLSSSSLRSDAARDGQSLAVAPVDAQRSSSRSSSVQPTEATATDEEMQNRRMEDLLKSMARMETSHRETLEGLTAELAKTKRDHGDLVALSRDQALNVSAELDGLRNSLAESEDRAEDLASQLKAFGKRETDAADSRSRLVEEHESTVGRLRSEHDAALQSREEEAAAALARLQESHADDLKRAEVERGGTLSESQEEHAAAIATLHQQHTDRLAKQEVELQSDLDRAKAEHLKALDSKDADHAATLERLHADHAAVVARLTEEKAEESERLRQALSKSREEHVAALHDVRTEADQKILAAEERLQVALGQAQADHENALDKLEEDLSGAVVAAEDALQQLETIKAEHAQELGRATQERSVAQAALTAFTGRHDSLQREHSDLQALHATRSNDIQSSLDQSEAKVAELERALNDRDAEAKGLLEEIDALQAQVDQLRSEQQRLSQAVSSQDSLMGDLDSHRTSLTSVQEELQATKSELEALHVERVRQEEAMRDLQRRLSDFTTSPATDSSEFLTDGKQRPLSFIGRASSPIGRGKPPPPTPPPNMPPPPLPSAAPGYADASEGGSSRPVSQVNTIRTNSFSSTSGRRSPRSSNSVDGSAFPAPPPVPDPRLLGQIEEQRENIKNLNKRLQHCEADLQANIDLVNTLEAALNDSERALRKARLSANDIAKERDRASSECETLRSLLQHARAEVLSVKSSADNDSRQLEEKMADEMRQRENAKRELEERLEAMQNRKSKFNCF